MRILFDQGTPVPLKQHFPDHQVQTAFELGWLRLTNGDLLAAAEEQFDVIVTTDQTCVTSNRWQAASLLYWYCRQQAGRDCATAWVRSSKHSPR
jgi:hypothetical protein